MHESMLENGLDFILDAANLLKNAEDASDAEEKEKALKYSMLHLSSGIELMMKFRLYIDNWTYIFADMNKADKHKLNSGDLITVDYERCIERLYSLCNVKISDNNKRYFSKTRRLYILIIDADAALVRQFIVWFAFITSDNLYLSEVMTFLLMLVNICALTLAPSRTYWNHKKCLFIFINVCK